MVRKTMLLLLAAIVFAAAGLTGCAPGAGTTTGGDTTTTTAPSAPTTPPAPTVKPPFQPDMLAAITKVAVEKRHMKVSGVAELKTRQDTSGRWWAAGTAIPVQSEKYDPLRVVIVQKDGVWTLFALGDDVDPEDLPADVRGIL